MKKRLVPVCCLAAMLMAACSKSDTDVNIQPNDPAEGSYIADGDTLNTKGGSNGRNIKGILKAGSTYYLYSDYADAVVNTGDTLIIQSGVKVLFAGPSTGPKAIGTQGHAPGLIVNGTLLVLGAKASPVLFTVQDPALRSDPAKDPQSPNTDPAFKGYWGGIQGGVTSGDIIIKWAHLEYLGGLAPATDPARPNKARYGIFTQNPKANFVLEDCWLYGSFDDMVRVAGGKFEILRNTFEKVGFQAGECVNVKSGSVGDIAYNLVLGGTGNAFKSANAGGLSPQANANIYNNTIVNTGYRQAKVGEGGSLDFENGGSGLCYNNLLVNCAFGLAIMGGGSSVPIADTANIDYGNTYNYGDKTSITSQFLPSGYITAQQPTDINGGNATTPGANNPLFVNYPLPVPAGFDFINNDFVGNYNFRLQANSPAVGKGYTGFAAYGSVKKDATYGATEITPPGKDIGAFQQDNTGNQH
ncbi:hypothetical protein F0L74_24925 [Chitinophaga agrisoli]|uniref:Parallel beta helix pectate lyase-like protein n=1 Tax=Chitinophaga agrisoli TaxID=2607653 RepID=A0A5B2VL62_9BACT|nr:hypothetical protein [Chitinophaga agrisoli]KAA2239448.1 hypothetical protein F0L74_24925 [Chitinophaga agrisoli]